MLGSKFTALREACGLTKMKLSALSGVSRVSIVRIEQGKSLPSNDTLRKLFAVLEPLADSKREIAALLLSARAKQEEEKLSELLEVSVRTSDRPSGRVIPHPQVTGEIISKLNVAYEWGASDETKKEHINKVFAEESAKRNGDLLQPVPDP